MARVAGGRSRASQKSVSVRGTSARQKSTGMKRTESAAARSRSTASSTRRFQRSRFVICVDADGHDDLQIRHIYQALPDQTAARSNFIRVVDDSGEDYLYPSALFLPLHPSSTLRAALRNRKGPRRLTTR